jgi:DNA mismatch repair protein MutL
MAISALPEATVRLLGSSTTIVTPQDLVKELLDNAIDADATSIEVTVSSDTVEKIQVRDNGHGIPVCDFTALGRRAHTSKLRNFEELTIKGGTTLGFRGEALAAANSLSRVTITTRTSSDPIASRLRLRLGDGGVEENRPISAPVGTTVQANKLFEGLPVRKQFISKQCHKNIASIKALLIAYALARPTLRLSLKIQGHTQLSWVYTPRESSHVQEAVLQLFGRNVAAECIFLSTVPVGNMKNPGEAQMETAMPRSGCDVSVFKSAGFFIAVDGRPLSSSRGVGKKLVAIFKSHLRHASSHEAGARPPANTFMYLSICCVPGSYDPNVAPLKDEVLFKDEARILQCFENLCKRVYDCNESSTASKLERSSTNAQKHLFSIHDTTKQHIHSLEISSPVSNKALDAVDSMNISGNSIHPDHRARAIRSLPLNKSTKPGECLSQPTGRSHLFNAHELAEPSSSPAASQVPRPKSGNDRHKGQSDLISEMMRTKMRVDLSRQDSNATDEETMSEMVEVQVPKLRCPPTAVPTPKPRIPRSLGSIKNYFQSRRSDDFEIAVDHTATAARVPSPSNVNQPEASLSNLPYHQPLQPLTAASLNLIQGEAELIDEISSSDITFLPSGSSPLRILNVQHADSIDDLEVFRNTNRQRLLSSPAMPPPTGIPSLSSPQRGDPHGLQTPPSSNPTRNGMTIGLPRISNPSRLPLTEIPSSRQRATTHNNGEPPYVQPLDTGSGTIDPPRIQASTTPPRGRVMSSFVPSSGFSRNDLDHAVMTTPQKTQLVSKDPSLQKTIQGRTMQDLAHYSHALQTVLMKTPGPPSDNSDEGTLLTDNMRSMYDQQICVTPQDIEDKEGPDRLRNHQEDPCGNLMGLDAGMGQYRRLQRSLSKNLPLESIPKQDETWGVILKTRVRMHQLRLLVQFTTKFGSRTRYDEGHSALRFSDMTCVRELEDRLKNVVGLWKESRGLTAEVQFTLASQAKGKSKVQMDC